MKELEKLIVDNWDDLVFSVETDLVDVPIKAPMDPVLKKLLDELPQEDPDRKMAAVWINWCEGRHRVPIGVETHIEFGPWYGPPMESYDIKILVEVDDGSRVNGYFENRFHVGPHSMLSGDITVHL